MGFLATLSHPGAMSIEKSKYGRATSKFATAYDNQELVEGAECEYDQSISDLNKSAEDQCDQIISDLKKIVSDLNKSAEDQCEQIISDLKKAAVIDPGYDDAYCDRGRADDAEADDAEADDAEAGDAEGEFDFTELQKDYTQMKTIKHFRLHIETCDVYAIEQHADASLVGSCGPLAEDDLKDLDSYDYSDEQNKWVQENIDRLILWFP
jgi:hypothetical protein